MVNQYPSLLDNAQITNLPDLTRDLADINHDGCLTRDGFAVAMHLIQKKLGGQEIPVDLPPSLMPPSARAPVTSGSPFSPPHTQTQRQQPEPFDLFSFDDTPPSSAVSAPMQTMHTGTLRPQVTGPASSVFSPPQPSRPIAADPFSSAPFRSCTLIYFYFFLDFS